MSLNHVLRRFLSVKDPQEEKLEYWPNIPERGRLINVDTWGFLGLSPSIYLTNSRPHSQLLMLMTCSESPTVQKNFVLEVELLLTSLSYSSPSGQKRELQRGDRAHAAPHSLWEFFFFFFEIRKWGIWNFMHHKEKRFLCWLHQRNIKCIN